MDQAQELAAAHQEFVKQWDIGTFPGWPVRIFSSFYKKNYTVISLQEKNWLDIQKLTAYINNY